MRYVTDLLAVQPEEIQLKRNGAPITRIIHVPEKGDVYNVLVVDARKAWGWFNISGHSVISGEVCFIYKPKKVKYLKPLHKILAENPGYYICDRGFISFNQGWYTQPDELHQFGRPFKEIETYQSEWPESFYEEVEE